MYTFEIVFRGDEPTTDEMVEAATHLLNAWYKNGQILSPVWPLAISGGLRVYVSTPAEDALSVQHANRYVEDAAGVLRSQFGVVIEHSLVGRNPQSAEECVCTGRSAYVLFTHFLTVESPLICLDCFRPLPLYAASPSRDVEYHDVLTWADDYRACDTLQMHTAVGERFGERQLGQIDSALSRRGLAICRQLALGLENPVYYYLHRARGRSVASEHERRCPSCGSEWRLEQRLHDRFDFRCDTCHLLSNVGPSLGS